MSMLALLEAVGHGRHGDRIPRCGALLSEAKAQCLLTFDSRGTPHLSRDGLEAYSRLYANESARVASEAAHSVR